MVCLSCGKQGHYNKLNFMCPLNNKNQANAVKYGAQEELQQKEDNGGTGNLPPSTDTIGMTTDGNFMPAAGSGKTIFTGTGAGMASLEPVVHTGSTGTGSTRGTGGEKTSLPDIYLPAYELNSYTATAEQHVVGTENFTASVLPPVRFGEETYVEDTEDDDVLTDELAEKMRMMVLLQAIEWDD